MSPRAGCTAPSAGPHRRFKVRARFAHGPPPRMRPSGCAASRLGRNIGKRVEKRILPAFGNLPFVALDADRIGAWKARLLGAIPNAALAATTCPTRL
jgi:hypothetical protein